jgi:hypothetical protein
MFRSYSVHAWKNRLIYFGISKEHLKKPTMMLKQRDNVQVKEFTLEELEDIFQAVIVVKQKNYGF